jgi:hypothetical protein
MWKAALEKELELREHKINMKQMSKKILSSFIWLLRFLFLKLKHIFVGRGI